MKNIFPAPAAPTQLMFDLLCTPVSMRGDRLLALVRDLALGTFSKPDLQQLSARSPSPRELAVRAAAQPAQRAGADGEPPAPELMPWEEPIFTITGGVAVLEVNGALVKGYDPFTCWYYGVMSTDRLLDALHEISHRTDIVALILKLNTPGGMSIGMPECADALVQIGQRCITIAHTSDLACSNGMRLAVACRIFLPTRSAIVGCIGTYVALYDYSEMLKEWGIKLDLFRDGTLKGIGLMGKELTKEERAFLDADVQANGKIFKDFVRQQRPAVTDDLMQGQWFSGERAVELDLADGTVTGYAEVLTRAQAGIATLLASAGI